MINYEERNWELRWMKQGHAQGERAGEQRILHQLLQRRFGPINSNIEQRLQQADSKQLLDWSLNLLEAETLEQIFRP
ncbi:DUF4351 domain-containing protein [Alcaligenes sp. Marseille-Q7550]